MSYLEYSGLLCKISQRLDQLNQHEHLLFMCRRHIASRPENIPNALSLLRELEEQNNLAIDQVELLKDLLKEVGEWSLFQKVRKFEEKRKEYNELLEQISRALDQSNQLQQFIVVCTERGTLEENDRNTQTGRVLFEKLERRGHFAFNRLDFLKGILSEIERQDLVEKVQDFEKRRIDEDEFERRKAQAGSIVAAARVVGGRVIGVLNMKTVCGAAAAGITLLTLRDILTRWSTYDQLVACFQKCVLPASSRLIEVGRGCVCFTIQVDNLMGLTALWNRYEDGTLKERLFDFFVTDEMKTRAGGEENVELTVTIEREEYEKAYFELVQEADGNQRRILERGVRRHSDSVLSVPPKDEEKSLVTLTQVKNQVKSLEERMEVLETQMVPFEKAHEYVNFEDKFRYIMTYVNDLQNETRSIMSESSDSGLPTSGAQSEIDLECVDESEITSTELDQWNLLSSAIKTGHVTTIERILSQGFDINSKYSHDGETLLMIAARYDNLVVVRYLLDKGADPNSSNWFDRNSLHLASQSGNVAIIEIFLSRGLDINSKDRFGDTPLIFAAASGKSEAVDYLLDNGADFFAKGKLGRSGLHAASQSGSVATIETMLSRGLGIDSKDRNGDTPLIIAAVCGKSEAFNYLFHKGADPWVRGNFGRNLLHAASAGGNVTIIKTVFSLHEDINSKDGDGNTALIIAALSGNCEAFHYLLENDAHPSVTGWLGWDARHAALQGGNDAIIKTVMSLHSDSAGATVWTVPKTEGTKLPPVTAAADAPLTKSVGATTPTTAAVASSTTAADRVVHKWTKGSGGPTARETHGNGDPRPPRRPGYGTKGRPIALRANLFRLNVSPGLSDLYHYDVEITPDGCPKSVKRDVVNEIINKHKKTTFQGHHPAFDGEKNLYSRIKLPVSAELDVKLPGEFGSRDRVFKVKIQFAASVSLLELNNFLSGKKNGKVPQDSVQGLDIVVRQMPSMYYTPVGRSFFPFDGQGRPLGEGCEVKFGFYSSIRHSEWKAMLVNIDVSAKGFYKDQPVVPDFLCETLDVKHHQLEDCRFELDRWRLEKAIRGGRIQTTHAASIKRKYTVWGVSEKSADRMQFDVTDEGKGRTYKTTVGEYFKERYKLILRYPHLPCLQVGQKKDRYLPMEVCTIIPCHRKHLSEQQTANMIRSTARPAPERQRDIQHWVQEMNRASSKYLKDEFQTSVSTEMVKVEGRVLPAPRINLGPQDQPLVPRDGSWDMRNKSLHDGARIDKWALACFDRGCREEQLRKFSMQMASVSSRQGLRMSEQPVVVAYGRGARDVESLFSKWVVDFPGLQLIMAVLPERDKQIYPELKRVGDNVIGIPTQGVKSKNVYSCKPQLCANLALKINSKLGGINHVIDPREKSPVFREPVIIFGADVTHPSPTENGIPSIAAVVASMDANATKYYARVRAQNHRNGKAAQEIINDLAAMVRELLIEFYKANRKLKPNKIIFYRDGVSEGQFDQVLVHEVRAVQQACMDLEKDYRPRITFVVVQKRHHTRLFCENKRDEVGKASNVPPGTTVDSGITHPYEFDFYLCSHYGIQGTSRPTHYHVLYDDNSFTADGLQQLTYQLCHVYARCTRSVSMPAPAYYAHLVAFRARHHVTGNGSLDLKESAKAIEVNAKMKGAMYFT